ncbi:MAG: hypothetical protein OEU86_07175 [Gammaproteobacteria bacterium]|nr:hypothetical protein [Gammaproteobacteria bacterium]
METNTNRNMPSKITAGKEAPDITIRNTIKSMRAGIAIIASIMRNAIHIKDISVGTTAGTQGIITVTTHPAAIIVN